MKQLFLAIFIIASLSGPSAMAALIDAPVPSNLILNDGAGNEWVWAGPCSPVSPSCGVADFSLQGVLGWEIPETEDFSLGFSLLDFAPSGVAICGSSYFSNTYSHCDVGDYNQGNIYNYPDNSYYAGASWNEFFAIRRSDDAVAVPEPGALSLLGLGMLGLGVLRRRSGVGNNSKP